MILINIISLFLHCAGFCQIIIVSLTVKIVYFSSVPFNIIPYCSAQGKYVSMVYAQQT